MKRCFEFSVPAAPCPYSNSCKYTWIAMKFLYIFNVYSNKNKNSFSGNSQ